MQNRYSNRREAAMNIRQIVKDKVSLRIEFWVLFIFQTHAYVQCALARMHICTCTCTCSRIIKNSRLHHSITFSTNVQMAAFYHLTHIHAHGIGTLTFVWIFAYRTLLVFLSNFSSWCSACVPPVLKIIWTNFNLCTLSKHNTRTKFPL